MTQNNIVAQNRLLHTFFSHVHHLNIWIVTLAAAMCGAILPLALAPVNLWLLAIISPALLYYLLHQRSSKHGFIIGWAYGFGLWAVGGFWLYHSIHYFGDTNALLAWLMVMAVAAVMGLFNAIQGYLYRRFLTETPLSFAALWVITEWSKTWLFTGFPWLFVGYAMTTHTLASVAPVAGVFAVSFLCVFIGAALVEVVRRKWLWSIAIAAIILACVDLNTVRWTHEKVSTDQLHMPARLSVSLIQGNIPQDLKWLTTYREKTIDIYSGLSQSEWGRDMIVWPESSIPMFQTEASDTLFAIHNTALAARSTWVTGIPYLAYGDLSQQSSDYWPFYNSIIAAGFDGSGIYKKQRLVPFGEYIPLSGLLTLLPAMRQQEGMASFSAGSSAQAPLQVKHFKLAAAICYEIAYPNITRNNAKNSDFLVTLSNDAWFDHTYGPHQHLQMAQMRALENGRWIIRATNTGISAFINAQGDIVSQTPQYTRTVLRGDLPAMQGMTPYTQYGDVIILALCSVLLAVSTSMLFRRKRNLSLT